MGDIPVSMLPCMLVRVPTAQGKRGKWPNKFPVMENTGNFGISPKYKENTGNLFCSSC